MDLQAAFRRRFSADRRRCGPIRRGRSVRSRRFRSWRCGVAAGIAAGDVQDAVELPKDGLDAPEASAGENRLGSRRIVSRRIASLSERGRLARMSGGGRDARAPDDVRLGNRLELIGGDESQGLGVQAVSLAGRRRARRQTRGQGGAPQRWQRISVRTMWWLVSRFSRMFSFAAGWKKLGQPLPESNLAVRLEQRKIAADADVHARLLVVEQAAAEGRFGVLCRG